MLASTYNIKCYFGYDPPVSTYGWMTETVVFVGTISSCFSTFKACKMFWGIGLTFVLRLKRTLKTRKTNMFLPNLFYMILGTNASRSVEVNNNKENIIPFARQI